MLIWDIIRDWFVQYIFGGASSNGDFYSGGMVGSFWSTGNGDANANLGEYYIPISGYCDSIPGQVNYIALSDWLSTTATLIVIIAVCFGLFMLVRYFFRLFSGLLTLK